MEMADGVEGAVAAFLQSRIDLPDLVRGAEERLRRRVGLPMVYCLAAFGHCRVVSSFYWTRQLTA